MAEEWIGWVSVLVSIVFFGIFAIPLKMKRVVDERIDPMVFQLYMSIAICISSIAVVASAAWHSFVWTWWAVLGAALWVPASVLSIYAIKYVGLAIAQSTWAGATILVSFAWGSLYFHDDIASGVGTAFALISMCTGLALLAVAGSKVLSTHATFASLRALSGATVHMDQLASDRNHDDRNHDELIVNDDDDDDDNDDAMLLQNDDASESESDMSPTKRFGLGMGCAFGLGLFNGSMLVPTRLTPDDATGVVYVGSFGVGVLLVTPILFVVYFGVQRRLPEFKWRAALLPGSIAGVLWNIGNIASIFATLGLGLTIGFPLTQLALLVGSLIGIIVFDEMTHRLDIACWALGAFVLLVGAFLLSFYG
jgi:glucose uptake protein GlcU